MNTEPPMCDTELNNLIDYLATDHIDEYSSISAVRVKRLIRRLQNVQEELQTLKDYVQDLHSYRTDKITPVGEAIRQVREEEPVAKAKRKVRKN